MSYKKIKSFGELARVDKPIGDISIVMAFPFRFFVSWNPKHIEY